MKKGTLSFRLTCLLSLTALLATGCGSTGGTSGPNASVTPSSASASGTPSENPIKWSGKITVAPYMFSQVENDIMTPMVEEKLLEYGYDVDLENVYIENGQYAELLNIRIASGDAPDIFRGIDDAAFLEYNRQGVIANWEESFFRENAPAVAAFIDSGGPNGSNKAIAEVAWKMTRYEGKMASVPYIARQTGSPINVIYNKQWLEKLNAQVPETLDDFVKLMYRFKNEDPDNNGKNDTYGLSTTMLNVIFGACGSFPGFLHMDYGHWYDVDGQLVAADIMPGNKEALSLIRQFFADGILDPEFVTGENTGGYWAISQSFVNGRIGVTHSAGMGHYQPVLVEGGTAGTVLQEFQKIQGTDANVVIGPWIEGPNGDRGGFLRYAVSGSNGSILYNADLNKDMDKLAALFQIQDIFARDLDLCNLALNGIEGEHYTFQEGGWTLAAEGIDNKVKNQMGLMALRSLYGAENPSNDAFFAQGDNDPGLKWRREIQSTYSGLAADVGYLSKLYTALPSQSKYQAELQAYRDEMWLKIIQGTLPIDYYDTYVQEWKSKGGSTLTEEANAWYSQN